ncbi:hypothetical protein EDC04DRAFT_1263501 [Pisolithus marmoratus]|nr:hypothetical protein EDC04DRAFT_1263501 [Pisolithus marmoratus]
MALETSTNRHYFIADPPLLHTTPSFQDHPHLRPAHRHSTFAFPVPARAHSASSGSVKSERYSPPHSDPSLSTLQELTFHSPSPSTVGSLKSPNSTQPLHADHHRLPLRFGMVPLHSNSPSDGWNFKRSHPGPVHGSSMSIDIPETSYTDEYDDGDDIGELPLPSNSGSSHGGQAEKVIRRRSSKACDQCRKSKCKCERTTDGTACKNCTMLGTGITCDRSLHHPLPR